jgi:hypothetical protein
MRTLSEAAQILNQIHIQNRIHMTYTIFRKDFTRELLRLTEIIPMIGVKVPQMN